MEEIKEKLWELAEEAMNWQALYSQIQEEEAQENIATQSAHKIGEMITELCNIIKEVK